VEFSIESGSDIHCITEGGEEEVGVNIGRKSFFFNYYFTHCREEGVRNYTTLEALKTVDFYLAFLINFFNSALTGLTSSTVKTYGRECGFDNNFLVLVLTLSSVFNCLGRLTWGVIGNRYSFKVSLADLIFTSQGRPFYLTDTGCLFLPLEVPLLVLQTEWAFLWLTYGFVTQVGGIAAKALFAVWTFLLYTCLAANFVLIPNLATRIFGPKSMPTIFGLLFTAMVCGFHTLILSGVFAQYDIRGQWIPIYCAGAGFAIIGLILTLFLRDPVEFGCIAWLNTCVQISDCCRTEPREEVEEAGEEEWKTTDSTIKTDFR
ncbi:unnamed protein product, partial [Hydatigera taeniaeformis]|uniref:Equilibrative nucleoside transporter 1 n=1 Tax=Hydatigena taeniaeformis TaxID=6205 RepID=A0A0R3XD29_HYDTA